MVGGVAAALLKLPGSFVSVLFIFLSLCNPTPREGKVGASSPGICERGFSLKRSHKKAGEEGGKGSQQDIWGSLSISISTEI